METIVVAVLYLPSLSAATTTPAALATIRRALTNSSRNRIMNTDHTVTAPKSRNSSRAENTRQLVGDGVQELAEIGDLVARARQIAVDLIGARQDHIQNEAAAASGPSNVLQSVPATLACDRAETIMNTGIKNDANARHDVGGRPNTSSVPYCSR